MAVARSERTITQTSRGFKQGRGRSRGMFLLLLILLIGSSYGEGYCPDKWTLKYAIAGNFRQEDMVRHCWATLTFR